MPNLTSRRRAEDEERAVRTICEKVQGLTGIQLGADKHIMVRSRLAGRLRSLGISTMRAYADELWRDRTSQELGYAIDLLTTNKTSFYREERHFELLKDGFMAARGDALSVWSAGCSTGEEPYTIALTALETSTPVRVLATDLAPSVVAHAVQGRYDSASLDTVPRAKRDAYFVSRNGEYEIRPSVRALVSFATLNLLNDWPMRGPFHAIFCRNVMIYFDKPTRQKLVERFREKLAPGGRLYIGRSESLTGLTHGYQSIEPGVYER